MNIFKIIQLSCSISLIIKILFVDMGRGRKIYHVHTIDNKSNFSFMCH